MSAAAALWLAQAVPASAVPRCRWEERRGDTTIVQLGPERDCKPWQPARRIRGVWLFEFEGSRFVEGARTLDEALHKGFTGPGVHGFTYDERSRLLPGCLPALGEAYLLDVEARERMEPARLEPMPPGYRLRTVLLDRVRTMTDLGSLPGRQVRTEGVHRCEPGAPDKKNDGSPPAPISPAPR